MLLCWVALELWWRYNYSEYGTLFMQFVIQNYNTTKFPLLVCTHPADGTLDRYSFHSTGISILQVNVELISRITNRNSSSSFMVSSIDGRPESCSRFPQAQASGGLVATVE